MKPVSLTQGTPEWVAWRAGGIGASDAACVMNLSPYRSRADVFKDKLGRSPVVDKESYAMRRGHRYEPQARFAYEQLNDCVAAVLCGECGDAPYLRCSFDGWCTSRLDPGLPPWLIEIKAPKWQDHDSALAGHVPRHYWVQCQHALFVSGLGRCDYVSINDGKRFAERDHLAVVPVAPDAEFLAEYLDAAEAFWGRVLRRLNRPRRERRAA